MVCEEERMLPANRAGNPVPASASESNSRCNWQPRPTTWCESANWLPDKAGTEPMRRKNKRAIANDTNNQKTKVKNDVFCSGLLENTEGTEKK